MYKTTGEVNEQGSKYVIASKTSMGKYKNNNPGPGQYNPYDLNDMKDKPRYTFGMLTSKPKGKKIVPGPGAYEHKSYVMNRPSSKFGRAKR